MIIKDIKYDKNLITLNFKDEDMSLIIQSNKPFPKEYAESDIKDLQKLLKEGKEIELKKIYYGYLKDINNPRDISWQNIGNPYRIYLIGLRDGGYIIKNVAYTSLIFGVGYDECVLINFMFENVSKLTNLKLIVKERN